MKHGHYDDSHILSPYKSEQQIVIKCLKARPILKPKTIKERVNQPVIEKPKLALYAQIILWENYFYMSGSKRRKIIRGVKIRGTISGALVIMALVVFYMIGQTLISDYSKLAAG